MLDLQDHQSQLLAFGTGVLLHIAAYRRGEWDLFVPTLSGAYGLLGLSLVAWNQIFNPQSQDSLSANIKTMTWLSTLHFAGISLSMVIYRLFFHRLRQFPGPFWARISNIYVTVLSSKKLHLYEEIEALHQRYGDVVRVGPNELSIIEPKALEAIYSTKSPCRKGPWYNVLHPRVSLQMVRDKTEHARRRKIWDRGFRTTALRDYEPRVARYTTQLLSHIEATAGSPINATDWFNFYSFDIMGDLAFGKSFNMLRDGVKHYFMKCLHADMTNIGYLSHLVWLFPLVKITPGINAEHLKFWAWCTAQVQDRMQMKLDRPDVFSPLLEDYETGSKNKQATLNLEGDAYLIAVAGSDTTAATLTNLFFELATHKPQITRLRIELDAYFSKTEQVEHISLSKLTYLDAVINETLRLHPPVPSGLQRETPPEGIQIGEMFIPGNALIQVPLHTIYRDSRNFEKANEFIPERWTTQPELNYDASVFSPFSIGPDACIGKQLALMELRYVVAQVVYRYDVALAPGQNSASFLDGKRDTFTLALGPLNLVFSDRAKV